MAEEFFSGLSIEARSKGALKGLLLDEKSDARRTFLSLRQQIPSSNAALRRAGELELGAFTANSLLGVQETSRTLDSLVERQRVADPQARRRRPAELERDPDACRG